MKGKKGTYISSNCKLVDSGFPFSWSQLNTSVWNIIIVCFYPELDIKQVTIDNNNNSKKKYYNKFWIKSSQPKTKSNIVELLDQYLEKMEMEKGDSCLWLSKM